MTSTPDTTDAAQLRDAATAYIAARDRHRQAQAAAYKLRLAVMDTEDALLAELDRKAVQAVACCELVLVVRDEYWDVPRGERVNMLDGVAV